MSAQIEFDNLVEYLGSTHGGVAGQMFGKQCIKINGKAEVALVVKGLPKAKREQIKEKE